MSNTKNRLKLARPHQWLLMLAAVWIIILLLFRLFVPIDGHRSWWDAVFNRKTDLSNQLTSPVPQTDDNVARTFVLDFYHSYTTTTESGKKKSLVAKNSSSDFNTLYLAANDLDAVTCTQSKVTNVQIANQILFAQNLSYSLIENGSDGSQPRPVISLAKVNNIYQVIGISCGPKVD